MCYDISYQITLESVEDYFGSLVFADPQIQVEFIPSDHTQGVAVFGKQVVVYEPKDDERLHCRMMEWGVIKFFEKEEPQPLIRNKMLNIRSERVLDDKTSYWYKIRSKRCLLMLSATFEHRGIVGWKKKVPYLIKPRGASLFSIPGLYSVANVVDKSTGEIKERWTFAVMTRSANSLMQNIHNDGEFRNRMPLFIPHDMAMDFVSKDLTEERYREILGYEISSGDLEYHPVWTIRTPKSRPDGGCKTDYFEWPGLPPLGEANPPDKELLEVS